MAVNKTLFKAAKVLGLVLDRRSAAAGGQQRRAASGQRRAGGRPAGSAPMTDAPPRAQDPSLTRKATQVELTAAHRIRKIGNSISLLHLFIHLFIDMSGIEIELAKRRQQPASGGIAFLTFRGEDGLPLTVGVRKDLLLALRSWYPVGEITGMVSNRLIQLAREVGVERSASGRMMWKASTGLRKEQIVNIILEDLLEKARGAAGTDGDGGGDVKL